ncbi:MAG: acetylornithine deacetylase [Pseudomonadota bacterium]
MSETLLSQAIRLLDRLVAFQTISSRSNLELIEFIEEYLSVFEVSSRRYYDETRQKANLWATVGPEESRGIVWSGHTDVVPVEGQAWDSDPFTLRNDGKRLFGRGTTDMKGFLACALALVPDLARRKLDRPIHLCFSYDEEIGCIGVRSVINDIASWPIKPVGCIVGEPSNMKVVIGHKTKRSLRVKVTGTSAHSSLAPQSVNAVHFASLLVSKIVEIAERLGRDGPVDNDFSVPVSTGHVGTMHGGTQLNLVPNLCTFEFEFRVLPEQNADALVDELQQFARYTLLPQMHKIDPTTDISFDLMAAFPGLSIKESDPWVAFCKHASRTNDVSKVAYGAEAGLFQQTAAVPTVICGPGHIKEAHTPNESVAISELAKCLDVLRMSATTPYIAPRSV